MHGTDYLDATADLNEGIPFPDASFDTVLSSSVFEHLRRPQFAFEETARVLASGGALILHVPFYYWLHEEPHDYYRYTEYALRDLASGAGLDGREHRDDGRRALRAGRSRRAHARAGEASGGGVGRRIGLGAGADAAPQADRGREGAALPARLLHGRAEGRSRGCRMEGWAEGTRLAHLTGPWRKRLMPPGPRHEAPIRLSLVHPRIPPPTPSAPRRRRSGAATPPEARPARAPRRRRAARRGCSPSGPRPSRAG